MSDHSSPPPVCPTCGAPLPKGTAESRCPRCLMAAIIDPTQPGEPATAPRPPLTPEQLAPHFPQLEILELLGRGGMGVVYKARQKSLNRLVALKLLAPERADDPEFAARFEKEAQALAVLNHPHIVGVHDFGQAGGFYFLLMEFVDGVNLRQLLRTKRLTPEEALGIVPPVCEALQCAHDRGIVHRDIKPENLLIDKTGVVKIADFGIAKMMAAKAEPQEEGGTGRVDASASLPLGTPDYAAPEQSEGRADHRADIYSLGVVLYEMLTGERPGGVIEAPSKRVRVDVRIDEIVMRALDSEPELRFATASDFRTRVEAAVGDLRPSHASSPPRELTETESDPRTTFAAIITLFYAGAGLVSLITALRLGLLEMLIIMALGGAILWKTGLLPRVSHRSFRRGLSWTAFALSLPLIAMSGFFLAQVPAEMHSWNPGPAEVVFVPLTWLGMILLPWAGVTLWQASRAEGNSPRDKNASGCLITAFAIGLAVLVGALIMTVAVWRESRSPAPRLEVSCQLSEVRKNVLLVEAQLIASEGGGLVGIEMVGVDVSEESSKAAREAVGGEDVAVLAPSTSSPPRIARLLPNLGRTRFGLVMPDEVTADLARKAFSSPKTLQLVPREHVRAHQELFAITTASGDLILATLSLGRPELGTGAAISRDGIVTFPDTTPAPAVEAADTESPEQAPTTSLDGTMNEEILKLLTWRVFADSPGKYWRELAEVRRFREAAELIERYLKLHPHLDATAVTNLYFHAGHCRAMTGDDEIAIKHLGMAVREGEDAREDLATGLLWNDYVNGTLCFLVDHRPGLVEAHERLALAEPVNLPHLRVLDRLLAHFGKPYAEAHDTEGQDHRRLSADCFNRTWELLEKENRTVEEDERMLSLAHASLAHWRMREDCTDHHLGIGYWQISRVYAVLGDGGNAKRYGALCLAVSQAKPPFRQQEPPFFLGYAHEALARAALVQEDRTAFDRHLAAAREQAVLVSDVEERKLLEDDLARLQWPARD